ncbi:uncharacterized protein ARMOST_15897 [Armillaria ostoyae]|uniref:Uncharacterized protein n=1 Tax=Armillaria ostoyae TaxID=47428 RepID=A0A284RUQ4_ARMOS|nr:uncharacterized protein ARMOST_15897 [Armillaria ostoyae]
MTLPTPSSTLHSRLHYSLPSSSLRRRTSSPVSNSADSSTTSLIGPPGKKDARNGDMKDETVSGDRGGSFGSLRGCAVQSWESFTTRVVKLAMGADPRATYAVCS